MATGEMELDIRDTCSTGSEDNDGKSAASLTCPTCRSVIPVPPAGVADFQTSVFVEDSNQQSNTQPMLCSLPDGKQEAGFQCEKCQKSFCIGCRHHHDRLCLASQVKDLNTEYTVSSSLSSVESTPHSSVTQQLQKVEDVMGKLTEREEKMDQERSIVESSIHDRYTTLLHHAGEAREACLASLRETCQGVTDGLQAHIALAQQAQDTLTQQLSSPQPAPVTVPQLNAALFLDRDMQTILNAGGDQKASVLHHEMKDDTEALVSSIHSFMGWVVESGHAPVRSNTSSPSHDIGIRHGVGAWASAEQASLSTESGDLQALAQRLEDLACQVTMLQSANTHISQQKTTLNESNSSSSNISTLEKELRATQREMATLKGENTKLMTDHAALQREVTTLKNRNATALQDLAVVSSMKDRLHAELAKLQQDVISIQTDNSVLQTDVMQLKIDRDTIMPAVFTVQNDIMTMQGDVINAKNDSIVLQADCTSIKSGMNTIQNGDRGDSAGARKEITKLEADIRDLQDRNKTTQDDITTLKTDTSSMTSDIGTLQKHITTLQGDNIALKTDISSSKRHIASLQQSLQSAHLSLIDRTDRITALETCLNKACTQVAFHAWLTEDKITDEEETLICDRVVTNIGSSYSGQAGDFTAPVSGTYCFMVSTSPNREESETTARLRIMLNDKRKGYVWSCGRNWSTGHVTLHMTAGQRVWLKTYSDEEYTYAGKGWTRFSGMLLQPDI